VQALSGVQLHADESGSQLRATDMEVGLKIAPDGVRRESRRRRASARLLLDVIRSLSGPEVTLTLRAAEQDVEIRLGRRDLPPAHPP